MRIDVSRGRHAGLLVPLFSLPTTRSWGIGEILDLPVVGRWLSAAGLDLLQILPINEMPPGQTSPYSAITAMAIDPIFISMGAVDDFADAGGEQTLDPEARDWLSAVRASKTVEHDRVRRLKNQALRLAFEHFHQREVRKKTRRAAAFEAWARDQRWWLDDYALFRTLHARFDEKPWKEWPSDLRTYEPRATEKVRRELAGEIQFYEYVQWLADSQWHKARAECPVALFGDLPFMVDGDSADVWAHQELFDLDACVGVPPDAFSETGQNWGLPVYRWDRMAERDDVWLRQRARRSAVLYDGYRIDHLVGFYRTYMIPNDGSKRRFRPADEEGQLRQGERVLGVFASEGSRIIAEDLGTVPDFVRASLARLGIPGYRVFRWEREWHQKGQPFRDPAGYPAASVATSGTHDTEPMAAWWESALEEERVKVSELRSLQMLVGTDDFSDAPFTPQLRDALLEILFSSGSDFLILPVQDVFGWRDRINVPATVTDDNWTYRLPWPADTLDDQPEARERVARLRDWAEKHERTAEEGRRIGRGSRGVRAQDSELSPKP